MIKELDRGSDVRFVDHIHSTREPRFPGAKFRWVCRGTIGRKPAPQSFAFLPLALGCRNTRSVSDKSCAQWRGYRRHLRRPADRRKLADEMSLRLSDGKAALRAVIAAGCIGAVLFAVVLSAIPFLHEQVHGDSTVKHECAVTLLTAGNYQHTVPATISVAPHAPPAAFTHAPDCLFLAAARLDFSLLEHAPPAAS